MLGEIESPELGSFDGSRDLWRIIAESGVGGSQLTSSAGFFGDCKCLLSTGWSGCSRRSRSPLFSVLRFFLSHQSPNVELCTMNDYVTFLPVFRSLLSRIIKSDILGATAVSGQKKGVGACTVRSGTDENFRLANCFPFATYHSVTLSAMFTTSGRFLAFRLYNDVNEGNAGSMA